jgi:hypothetical protein
MSCKFDMVWPYPSPIPVGRRGVIPRSNDFYLPSLHIGKGERVGTLWLVPRGTVLGIKSLCR